jgi:hypothetical protein
VQCCCVALHNGNVTLMLVFRDAVVFALYTSQSLLHCCLGCEASTIAALKAAVQLCRLLAYASDVCLCNSKALKGNKSSDGLKSLAKCTVKPGQLPLIQLVSRYAYLNYLCLSELSNHDLHTIIYICHTFIYMSRIQCTSSSANKHVCVRRSTCIAQVKIVCSPIADK